MTKWLNPHAHTKPGEVVDRLDEALWLAITKVRRDAASLPAFPHVTENGLWRVSDDGRWTGGFFIGMLWLAQLVDPEPDMLPLIREWMSRLRPRATDCSTHDLGFLFEPSFVRGFNTTGQADLRATALDAAHSLASRFHAEGSFIEAWDDRGYEGVAIVDTVMNLPLLAWAAQQANEPHLWQIARSVAETIRTQHIRSDGSTWHVVRHDQQTGRVLSRETHQGASADSCWTRGQAWAFYGFARLARIFMAPLFWETAAQLADSYLARLGTSAIPPWDFDRSGPGEPRDSAAAAIAAAGLLDLWRATNIDRYRTAAVTTVEALINHAIDFTRPETPGLLLHATVDVPRSSGIDVSTIYGDHYFMEAIVKLAGPRAAWDGLGCVAW